MKTKAVIFVSILLCCTAILFAFSPKNNDSAAPIPEPGAMTIILTNVSALDYSNACYYQEHEYKVTFYGSRWSDGQELWDPSSPFLGDPSYFSNPIYCYCSNFYYQNGHVYVYTRPDSYSSWVFQGTMLMSSSNCTKIGDKVTFFTVNCQYLDQP